MPSGRVSHHCFVLVHKIQLIASGLKDWACGGRRQQRPGGTEKKKIADLGFWRLRIGQEIRVTEIMG